MNEFERAVVFSNVGDGVNECLLQALVNGFEQAVVSLNDDGDANENHLLVLAIEFEWVVDFSNVDDDENENLLLAKENVDDDDVIDTLFSVVDHRLVVKDFSEEYSIVRYLYVWC